MCTYNFVSTFSLFPHLTAFIHLYSAELLEPLSDKAMKESERRMDLEEEEGGERRSGSTTRMKVSLPRAAPDLSHDTQ